MGQFRFFSYPVDFKHPEIFLFPLITAPLTEAVEVPHLKCGSAPMVNCTIGKTFLKRLLRTNYHGASLD